MSRELLISTCPPSAIWTGRFPTGLARLALLFLSHQELETLFDVLWHREEFINEFLDLFSSDVCDDEFGLTRDL